MNRVFKIVGAVFIFFTFLIFSGEEAYATEGFGLWGNNQFTNSSGVYQTVPIGYGLTAIGYGSDDHKCLIGIKTAAVNTDGSVNFGTMDSSWRSTTCSGGSPGSGRIADQKSFEPSSGYIVTGWNWGANTSGGIPGNDSAPPDECFYQEYAPLSNINNRFGWGQSYDGTCNDRGYASRGELKAVVYAPAGRVIVGILLNIDDDAKLESLSMTTRDVKTANLSVSTNSAIQKTGALFRLFVLELPIFLILLLIMFVPLPQQLFNRMPPNL